VRRRGSNQASVLRQVFAIGDAGPALLRPYLASALGEDLGLRCCELVIAEQALLLQRSELG
jgi:hypothetical protein